MSVDIWEFPSNQYKRGKMALRTTCIKNVKFKIFKIRAVYQYMDYLSYSENLNWAAQTYNWAECDPRV